MKTYIVLIAIWILLGLLLFSCGDFLDDRPSKDIVVPNTVEDLYSILNSVDIMNAGDGFGLIFSDDIFITDAGYAGMAELDRQGYQWKKQLSNAQGNFDSWSSPYARIFSINVVLEESLNVKPASTAEVKKLEEIRGTAMFLRAFHYFELLEMFSHPLVNDGDLDKPAFPLKLNPSMDEIKGMATTREIYTQIKEDLEKAAEVLPDSGEDLLRPSKAACYGLLARVYLQLEDYQKVLEFADKSLQIKSELLDFNTIPDLANIPLPRNHYPIPRFNREVIMHLQSITYTFQNSPLTYVNQEVYDAFDDDDIRKYLYFSAPNSEGKVNFIGSFTGAFQLFSGITVGELYLMKSESLLRVGDSAKSLETLNEFLASRYYTGTFQPYDLNNPDSLLSLILLERRKELVYRGLSRWRDMRRYLGDTDWVGPEKRTIEGVLYELGINPLNYMIEIPPNEKTLNDKL